MGLPRRLDGSPNDQTPQGRGVRARLAAATRCRCVLQDERLSSHEAESRLAMQREGLAEAQGELDAAAAAVILQDYLDAHAPTPAWHPDDI